MKRLKGYVLVLVFFLVIGVISSCSVAEVEQEEFHVELYNLVQTHLIPNPDESLIIFGDIDSEDREFLKTDMVASGQTSNGVEFLVLTGDMAFAWAFGQADTNHPRTQREDCRIKADTPMNARNAGKWKKYAEYVIALTEKGGKTTNTIEDGVLITSC